MLSFHHVYRCVIAAVCAAFAFAVPSAALAQCSNLSLIDGRNLTIENACAPGVTQDNVTGFTDTQSARTSGRTSS